MKAFRDLIINIGGGCNDHHKPSSLWALTEGQDEPITKVNMTYTLAKPIKPGFRRLLTITPDEELDRLDNGQYATAEMLQGEGTFLVDPSSTSKSLKTYAYGDGPLGDKVARVHADGHIGEGQVEVTLDIAWTVAHPDATVLAVVEGPDEAIPTVPVP